MSASPASSSQTPNAAAPLTTRRPQKGDPLVRKRPPRRPPPPGTSATKPNGVAVAGGMRAPNTAITQNTAPQTGLVGNRSVPTVASGEPEDARGLHWPYEDYPIISTRKALVEGLRCHVIRFSANNQDGTAKVVDILDEAEFTRPVRLHRRDPRAPAPGAVKDEDDMDVASNVDDKERERQRIHREQRQHEWEEAQKQIAPMAKKSKDVKQGAFKRKTEQVYRPNDTEEAKKASQLRYEEALPWHLEDFDNKSTWVGSYEAALSGCHVVFITEPGGAYRLMPLDKWYKFTAKSQFKRMTIDEAEQRMNKKIRDPRWFLDTQKASEEKRREDALRQHGTKLFTRKGERGEGARVKREDEKEDVPPDQDDIDYDYDEAFADDEENPLFDDPNEDAKEAEEKIKREQREANVFDIKEQKDFDLEEEEAEEEARLHRKLAKSVRKALMKQEKNYVYEDDSEGNTSDTSESYGTDTAREGETPKKDATNGKTVTKPPSEASTKGTSTPSGRTKTTDPTKKPSLKRPGSPDLSDASGTEANRKKQKKQHLSSVRGNAPLSRPRSPAPTTDVRPADAQRNAPVSKPASRSSSFIELKRKDLINVAGSGSDGEASDGARKKKLKIRLGTPTNASPTTSRAQSPAAPAASATANGKQGAAGAKVASAAPAAKVQGVIPPWLTEQLIASKVPPEGIQISNLIRALPVHGIKLDLVRVTAMIKRVARFERESKMVFPR